MTIQINLRMAERFFKDIKEQTEIKGYLNIQEFIREAIREKLYDSFEVKSEYLKTLKSKDATNFKSLEQSKQFIDDLRKKAGQ